MTTPLEATAALVAAARTVAGLAGATADKAGATALPCVLVGAPAFRWSEFCEDPSGLTFPVTILVRLEGGAIEALLGFVADVRAVLERDTPASISDAFPLSYDLGNQMVAAAYELTVEYPL